MIRKRILPGAAAALVASLLTFGSAALGDVVSLQAVKDNTLYQNTTGAFSNGAGEHIFVGRVDVIGGGSIRRAVIAFNPTGAIPAGARITRVELTLNMSRTTSLLKPMTVHRLLADWGEGTSDAPAQEGAGTASTANDATWLHRFYPNTLWTTQGGDFVSTPSTTVQIGGLGSYTLLSTAALVADVQGWLDNPATNFGWLLRGDETAVATAKRFDSRQHVLTAARPSLTVEFSTGPGGSGSVPDGGRVPGIPLTVAPAGGGSLRLQWGPSCLTSDIDYEIYAGAIGSFGSHTPRFCTTGGLTSITLTPGSGSEYYLVVPRNASIEGSYGTTSSGAPRPQSATACLTRNITSCP